MSEFWLWFTRPFAEFAGSMALLFTLFLIAFTGLIALWLYHWLRRKVEQMWRGGRK